MYYPLTDIQADFEINRPVRYRNTAKKKIISTDDRRTDERTDGTTDGKTDGRTDVAYDNNRYFFLKKEKLLRITTDCKLRLTSCNFM